MSGTYLQEYFAHSSKLGSWQPLKEHLENTASLAAQFAKPFGSEELGHASGLLHDLGKYTIPFQQRLTHEAPPVDHSTAGAIIAQERFPKPIAQALAFCIAGHHSGLANGCPPGSKRSPLEHRLKKTFGKELPHLAPNWEKELKLSDNPTFPPIKPQDPKRAGFQFAFLTRMLFSCLVDADFQDTEAYFAQMEGAIVQRDDFPTLEELRQQLDHFLAKMGGEGPIKARRQQILASIRQQAQESPGNFSCTVPTGGGKTLTTLGFGLDHAIQHGMQRIIYIIPFTSIVEQNAAVFRNALNDLGPEAVLEHHSQFIDDSKEDRQTRNKLNTAMENWDAPIVVTTAVQFFESLFANQPSSCRKLHNITSSVIILDEAQTLPLNLLRPCIAALDELSQNYLCSVVMCTATQPAVHEDPIDPNAEHSLKGGLQNVRELAPNPQKLYEDFRRVQVSYAGETDDAALVKTCNEQKQILCIVNNRRHARTLYEALGEEDGSFHLTTFMCATHRSQVLTKIRERLQQNSACRVIATSLVEAGVDIDFPQVLRAETGLDSIAQAAGRCNREGKRSSQDSKVIVFFNSNWPPPPELEQYAQAAREVLRHYEDPLSLEAINHYFRLLYWQRESSDPNGLDKHGLIELMHKAQLNVPFEDIAQKFCMIEDHQRPVIIPWDDSARNSIRRLEYAEGVSRLARQLQPYTVNVPEWIYRQLRKCGAVQPIAPERLGEQFPLLVNESLYHPYKGLCWEDPEYIAPEKSIF